MIYRSLAEVPADFGPCCVTIGNFDGVHRGHEQIMQRVAAIARKHGWKACVLTFDPHPTKLVAPARAPRLLSTPEQRARLMLEQGIDQVVILPFTDEIARLTPEEFVREILVGRLQARTVLVGDNFRFGNRAAGDVRMLRELGRKYGFDTEIMGAIVWRNRIISSSDIRRLIEAGEVSLAGRMLGRPYALEGKVVRGEGVGSKQTVPTLNLDTRAEVLPKRGVYITRTRDCEGAREWPSITNVGFRPTFGGQGITIETYLLIPLADARGSERQSRGSLADARGSERQSGGSLADARGSERPILNRDGDGAAPEEITVEFLRWVRDERKFPGAEELKAQILRDVGRAQTYFRRVAR